MSSVLFFDPSCQQPYDSRTLHEQALNGTESTVTKVADALGAFVVQHNRTEAHDRYRPPERIPGIDRVVLLNDSRGLRTVRSLYPHARVYLWLHGNLRPRSSRAIRLAATARLLCETAATIICVSDSQRREVEAALRWIGIEKEVGAHTIYNPVDDALTPDGSPVDRSKLVFFSSPNKGLGFTLDAFRALRQAMPDLRLVVGNPGYKIAPKTRIEGVEYLGPQPQRRIHSEVRTALCTFCPNFVIPETFGLVYAESKALGTPILTHDCGAAAEVINDPRQILPVTAAHRVYEQLVGRLSPSWRLFPARMAGRLGLFDLYIERIRCWRQGDRPIVGPDPRFRMTTVVDRWRQLLTGSPQS